MAKLDKDQKKKRDEKVAQADEYISAREQIKERLKANYESDIARLDAEIAEHVLVRDGLKALT